MLVSARVASPLQGAISCPKDLVHQSVVPLEPPAVERRKPGSRPVTRRAQEPRALRLAELALRRAPVLRLVGPLVESEDRVIRVTREMRAIHVRQARAVARLAALEHLDEVRAADAPRSVIQIRDRQQVERRQPSVRPEERVVVLHAVVLQAQPLEVHRAQQLVDHGQVAVLPGEMTGQWATRATRAVGRRGQARQQQVGEALAAILAAILVVVLAAVLVVVLAAVLVLIHAASTEGLAGETLLVQGQQRGLLPVQGAALAPSLCLHLRPNADQPEPLTTRRRSRRFSAMC